MSFKVSELPAALLAGAAFIVIVAGIQAASAIVIPFLLAVFIASRLRPTPVLAGTLGRPQWHWRSHHCFLDSS